MYSTVRLNLLSLPKLVLISAIRFYQKAISPWTRPSCRYMPTCSEYAVQALTRYGALKGMILATHRLLRCNPWGGFGYDPPRWYGETATHECEHAVHPTRTAADG